MGQLFDRVSRAVRANLNNADYEDSSKDSGEGAALIAGGAAVGAGISATVGGIGLVSEPKTTRDTLKARLAAAKAQAQVQGTIGQLGTNSTMAAFERMEEKVLEMEARSQALVHLEGNDLERLFALLESGSEVDDELAAMKAQLTNGSTEEQILSTAAQKAHSSSESQVDDELEELRKQIDQL